MPEMMGMVLLAEMLSKKDGRRRHEFEELLKQGRRSGRFAAAIQRFRARWQ